MSLLPFPVELESALKTASFESALSQVLAYFGCQAGTWHVLKDGELHLVAACHIPPPVLALVQTVPIGKGIAGLAAQRLEPISLCNLQTDTSGQARPAAKGTGMEGSLAVPALNSAGQLCGVLGIAKAQAHDWTEAEKTAVTAAAALFASR
jgi:signal transduction protein with GAF and PtsI domain